MTHIIDTNDDIINSIGEIYRIATPNNLRSLIEKHFIPSKDEKKNNAEIPTPVKLVDDMLSKIPIDYWNNIHTTFEPCCGKGNFVLGIFDMFFNGLETKIPDKVKRCKTIMTKCIYFADLTNLNVFITTEILKCHIEDKCGIKVDYEFNSNVGDTLSLDIEKKWSIKGFDAVIGNPPYNAMQNNTGKKGGGDLLWNKFIKKSLCEWLNKNGYLCFVNPAGWRKPDSKNSKYHLFNLMTKENQMVYLEIHNTKDGMKTFGCGTRYDWYVIEKKENYKNTIVIDENGFKNIDVNMKIWNWLPNYMFQKIQSLLFKDGNEVCKILYSRTSYASDKKWTNEDQNSEFKYPCIHSTPKNGIRYYYSNCDNKGHFGIPKVIFGETGIYNAIIDNTGKYGITQHSMAIVDDIKNLENIKKALECKSFKDVLNACSWSNFSIDWRMFLSFKKDFWKEFITEDEIKNVKETIIKCKDNLKTDNKKYTCECGSIINKTGKSKHEKSLKHKNFIESR